MGHVSVPKSLSAFPQEKPFPQSICEMVSVRSPLEEDLVPPGSLQVSLRLSVEEQSGFHSVCELTSDTPH